MAKDYELITINDRELNIKYSGVTLAIPSYVRKAIDKHWLKITAEQGFLFNGDVFPVKRILINNDRISIKIRRSDYAHYMATRNDIVEVQHDPCNILYTGIVLQTSDNYFALAETAVHTSKPDRIQLIGGNVDADDINEDKTVNIDGNAAKELFEEIGLDVNNPDHGISLKPTILKKANNPKTTTGIFYLAKTALDRTAVKNLLSKHNDELRQKNIKVEIKELIFVENDAAAIKDFSATNVKTIKNYIIEVLEKLNELA